MTAPADSGQPPLDPDAGARAFAEDDARYFADADITQRLNLIRHLVQSTRLAIVISGETGAGKTASLEQLQRNADERWSLCRVAGSATRDADALLASLARCCDLPPDCGRPALRQLLAEHAEGLSRLSRLPVIAVDDAHALSGPAWVELVALMAGEDGWRLLLYVEPGSDALLAQAGLGSPEQLHRLQWPSLSEAQTGAYVGYRLSAAGWSGPPPLSADQLRKLHRDSRGLPGNINRLAPTLLADKRTAAPRSATPRAPAPATAPRARKLLRGAAVLMLVAAAAAVLTQQERINALFEPPPPQIQEPLSLPQAPSRQPGPETESPAAAAPSPRAPLAASPTLPPDGSTASRPDPGLEAAPATPAPDRSPPPAAPQPGAPTATEPAPDSAAGPAEAPSDALAEKTAEPAGEPRTAEAPVATEPDPPLPPSAPDEQPPSNTTSAALLEQPTPDAAPGTVPADDAPPASEPGAAAAAAATASAATVNADRAGEQWVLSRPASHYTLQLLASRELQPLRKLIERFELGADTAWYKIQYKGGDWYVLVHGDFPDGRTASDAVAALPSGLRRAGPWPRPLAAVQEEVRRGRK